MRSTPTTIWRSFTSFFPGRLIEPVFCLRRTACELQPQGRLRRGRPNHCMIRQLPAAPLRPLLFAADRSEPAIERKVRTMKGDRYAIEKQMKREEIEELREQVGCASVLEKAGFAIDL